MKSTRLFLTERQFKELKKRGYTYIMVNGVTFNLRRKGEDPVQRQIALLEEKIRRLRGSGKIEHKYKFSEEARKKISAARKSYWMNRKAQELMKMKGGE